MLNKLVFLRHLMPASGRVPFWVIGPLWCFTPEGTEICCGSLFALEEATVLYMGQVPDAVIARCDLKCDHNFLS